MPPKKAATAAAASKARKPATRGKNANNNNTSEEQATPSSSFATQETTMTDKDNTQNTVETSPPPAAAATASASQEKKKGASETKPKRAPRKRAAPVEDDAATAEDAAPKRAKRVKTSAKEAKEGAKPATKKAAAKETKKETGKARAPKKRETKKEKEAREKKEKDEEEGVEKDDASTSPAPAPKRKTAVPKSRAAAAAKKATAATTAAKVTKVTKTTTTTTAVKAKTAEPKPREPTPQPAAPAIINTRPTTRFELWSFGTGTVGELGVGPEKNYFKTPRPITALDAQSVGVVQVSAGGMHVVALTHDGKIYTWGQNDSAALGRDTTWEGGKVKDMDADAGSDSDSDDESNLNPLEATPMPIPDGFLPEGTNVVQVVAGDCATFALTDTGLVYGWGIFRNENGSWGFYHTPNSTPQKQAILISELQHITQLAAGENFTLALAQDGTVYSWGHGAQGQLGRQLQPRSSRLKEHALSYDDSSLTPLPLPFPKRKIVSIHAAANHAFAIDKTGGVWSWGLNNYSQTGLGSGAGESNAIVDLPRRVANLKGFNMKSLEGGAHFSIGVTQDGKCLTWGRMDGSQIGVPFDKLPLDDEKAVMKDDRGKPRIMLKPATVLFEGCCPNNDCTCVCVAAGSAHNIAVLSDGKAYAWGFNDGYRCAVGDDMVDDVVEPHRIENKLMKERKIVWAGAGGQYSLVGIEPENAVVDTAAEAAAPASADEAATETPATGVVAETATVTEEKKEEVEEEKKDEDGDSKMAEPAAEEKPAEEPKKDDAEKDEEGDSKMADAEEKKEGESDAAEPAASS